MIRQARSYLMGAMSGATLIAVAIGVFVLLVSAQVFRDWPLAALGGDDSAVAPARPLGNAAAEGAGGGPRATAIVTRAPAPSAEGAAAGSSHPRSADGRVDAGGPAAAPVAGGPADTGGSGGAPADSQPSTTPPSPARGGSAGSTAGAGTPATGSGSAGAPVGGGSTGPGSGSGSSSGGSGSGGGSAPAPTTTSTAGALTETVNGTVNQVDEKALGGTLAKTGVTEVTEGVVNGVAGPESVVGKVVDGVGKALGGLLGGQQR